MLEPNKGKDIILILQHLYIKLLFVMRVSFLSAVADMPHYS